jgi:hypothetical protein
LAAERGTLPRVHVFGLGGTITMASTAGSGGVVPSLDARMLVDAVPQLQQVATVSSGITVRRPVPSPGKQFDHYYLGDGRDTAGMAATRSNGLALP